LPLWHTGRPAILKNRFDNVFHSWFAYKYIDWRPKGLLSPKTAKIFVTCGWPSFIYKIFPLRFKLTRGTFRLWFTGVKLKKITFIDKIHDRKKNPNFQKRLENKIKI
jgi:putative NADPH-quinone reductase